MKDVDMERERKELLRKIAIREKENDRETPSSPQPSKRTSSPTTATLSGT